MLRRRSEAATDRKVASLLAGDFLLYELTGSYLAPWLDTRISFSAASKSRDAA